MQAIILAGGSGTRLRPLSWRTPKQIAPILNRPLLEHLLRHLRAHGVTHVTLAMTAQLEAIRTVFGDGAALDLSIAYAYEDTPLGSGGAIASIAGEWNEPFLVCNGDVITDFDINAMRDAHHRHRAELSISLYEVEDPSPFGVVEIDAEGRIRRFVEKPAAGEAPSHLANAGMWIFDPALVRELDPSRFSRVEDTLFPSLCASGRAVYGVQGARYWADVGDARALLRVNLDLARGAGPAWGAALGSRALHELAAIAPDARIGVPAVIGAGTVIEESAQVTESLLWDGVRVERGAIIQRSILATGVTVGAGSVIEDAVIAHEVSLAPGSRVTGGVLEPGAAVAGDATHG